MRNIGIDSGTGKCIVCVVDGKGNVLERASYKALVNVDDPYRPLFKK